MLSVTVRESVISREVESEGVAPLDAVADTETVSVIAPEFNAVCVTVQLPVHTIEAPGASDVFSAGVHKVDRRASVN